MAFDRALYFIVGHRVGAVDRLITTQTRPARIRLTGAATASTTTWTITGARLFAADASAVAIGSATLASMFSITNIVNTLGVYTADLSLNKALAVANATLMNRFVNAGHVELDIEYDTGAAETLTADIRALKSASFLLNSNVGEVAHYPGIASATANLAIATSEVIGGYAFQVADAFNANLAPSGSFTETLTPSGARVDLAFPMASSAPSDVVTQTLLLKVTAPSGAAALVPMDVHVPTDFILLLDQSGSMAAVVTGTTTKWQAAVAASELFSKLYGELIQQLTVPGGAASGAGPTTLAQKNQIRIGRFTFTGGATQAPFTAFVTSNTTPAVPAASPGGGTPIGEALATAADLFTADKWRRRHLLLLTDGADNSGSPRLNTLTAADLPTVASSATLGVVVHIVSYALTGDTQVVTLSTFANDHGGQYHDSAADNLDPDALKGVFLSILADVLPVNRSTALVVPTSVVEEGVERAAFVATRSFAGTLSLSTLGTGGATATDNTQAGSSAPNGVCWTAVDGPAPGTWTASASPAGATLHVMFDLALRMRCGVEPQGLGQPIKVWAELRFYGEPLSYADVRVGTRAPDEALGELLTTFVQRGGLGKAFHRRLLGKDLFVSSVDQPNASTVDRRSVQRMLLDAAESVRNLPFQFSGSSVTLTEVSPGRYEGLVTATENENAYNFLFRADGITPAGHAFTRDHRLSAVLAPEPHPEFSDVSLVSALAGPGRTLWTATVFPRTVLKKPVGPGLADTYLSFQYIDPTVREKRPQLVTLDHLDGTYSTRVELAVGEVLPPLGLFAGPVPSDRTIQPSVVVKPRGGRVRQVKVRLDRIQVLDDKDGLFTGRGELAFSAVVAPNANPHRAVRSRFPEKGTLKVTSGQALDVDTIIYEGLVEADATLAISIGGTEFDYFLFFTREEKLARYHRRLPLQSVRMKPDDEPNDPENLSDWRVWYTVEVE